MISHFRFPISAVVVTAAATWSLSAQPAGTNTLPIDLPTALRLAGAQNLDVQIARQALSESEANRQSAVEQYFPWISPGISYHRREGASQFFPSGTVIDDARLQSYAPGATLTAQVTLGDAIYNSLAARQLVKASNQALERQRQDAALAAAQGYFDLVKAKALAGVVNEAIKVSRDYQQELHAAVGIVLEDLQAQQALTQARSDYVTALAEYNKAQYALSHALGAL